MSFLGRLMSLFPCVLGAAFLTCLGMGFWRHSIVLLALAPVVLYVIPPLLNRLLPLKEGRTRLDSPSFHPWWGSHQLQRIYIALPSLEAVLRLVPGLYSVWLRLWGARIGRNVYWTPLVEITDRSMLEVGDGVIFGHKVAIFAHAIKPGGEGFLLMLERICIGSGAFIGAGSRLGPGSIVEEGAMVPMLTDLYPRQRFTKEVP